MACFPFVTSCAQGFLIGTSSMYVYSAGTNGNYRATVLSSTFSTRSQAEAACATTSNCTCVYLLAAGGYQARGCDAQAQNLNWCKPGTSPICNTAQGGVTYFQSTAPRAYHT